MKKIIGLPAVFRYRRKPEELTRVEKYKRAQGFFAADPKVMRLVINGEVFVR